jgi:MYXO-CTERM domain-containing protein
MRTLPCLFAGLLWPVLAAAQTETIFMSLGSDSVSPSFAHASLPGATGIDFRLFGAFDGAYAPGTLHEVVIWFEWGPSAIGPWSASPDNVKTVPGAVTTLFDTHVYHGPEDAPFVRVHFAAGGLMTVSGSFTHSSVVPEPNGALLALLGLAALGARRRALGISRSR